MKCRKAFELDLAKFVVDKGSDQWAAFRTHYPHCPACGAEVAVWDEVETLLRSDSRATDSPHPPKDLLLRYEEKPETVPFAEKEAVAGHLATCRSCPDELAALRSFDFSTITRRAAPPPRSWRTVIGEVAVRIRLVVLHPAFAYALVLVLLYPVVRPRLTVRPLPLEHVAKHELPAIEEKVTTSPASAAPEATEPNMRVAAAPANPPEPVKPPSVAPPGTTEVGKHPARTESRKRSESRLPEQAIAKAPAASEPVAPGDGGKSALPTTNGVDALANEDLDDPDVDDPRVLGLADTEEPRAGAREPRSAAPWRLVELAPDRSPVVERATLTSGIALRLPSSAAVDDGRIVGPEGREIVGETVRPSATGPVEVRVRTDDLVAGPYRVQWQRSELHFTVR